VRPLQIEGAHTCACGPKPGRARCVRATKKMVTTHALLIQSNSFPFQGYRYIYSKMFNKSVEKNLEEIQNVNAIE
jgi:hypothetical protein